MGFSRNNKTSPLLGLLALMLGLVGFARAADSDVDTLIPLAPEVLSELNPDQRFSLGVDQLIRRDFRPLQYKRVLVATSRLALDSQGRHLLETLLEAPKPIVTRVILFNDELPESARNRELDKVLARHPDVRIFERSPTGFRPTKGMMEDTDVVLVDFPIRGPRFYGEATFLAAVLQEASLRDIPVVLLDRPAPRGVLHDGPPADSSLYGSPTSFYPLFPILNLTPGELAELYNGYFGIGANLTVLPLLNWTRNQGYDPLREIYRRQEIEPSEFLPEWADYTEPVEGYLDLNFLKSLGPQELFGNVMISGETATYTVDPASVGASVEDFRAALSDQAITNLSVSVTTGTLANGGAGEVVALQVEGALRPASAAIALWDVCASFRPEILPAEGEVGLFGATFVFDGLRQGLSAKEIDRRWQGASATRILSDRVSKATRYPNQ